MTETLREKIGRTPAALSQMWRAKLLVPRDEHESALSAAREEAARAERERAARVAERGCLVPPDGGAPTEDEREMCDRIAAAIRKGEDHG